MFKTFNTIRIFFRFLRALPISIWFNFRYLPLLQALKLPIFLYKPKFVVCQGIIEVSANSGFCSILLGFPNSSLYPNSGITLKIRGRIIFHGKASIPNASSIEVGEYGVLEFGDNFVATAQLKIGCHDSISFGEGVMVSWDNLFIDTDYHAVIKDGAKSEGKSPIRIGDFNWIGLRCTILKGTKTPSHAVVASNTLTNSDLSVFGRFNFRNSRKNSTTQFVERSA